jgi:hypothetical protein
MSVEVMPREKMTEGYRATARKMHKKFVAGFALNDE